MLVKMVKYWVKKQNLQRIREMVYRRMLQEIEKGRQLKQK
jgi:hypothetical protein